MVNINYGKYRVPDKLKKILALQDQLNIEGKLRFGDLLGYYFSLEDSRYLNTPLNVITFARPGMDGIHFGFLTDFGREADLEKAYIVRVSPMDFDDPVKIVARNLPDFMRILCFSPEALNMVDISTSKAYFEHLPSLLAAELQHDENQEIRMIFQNKFQLKPINNLYDYLQQVKADRNQETILPTDDGIGVVCKNVHRVEAEQYMLELKRQEDLDIEKVKRFFETSSYEAKLVFLRDAQSKGLLYDHPAVKSYLINQLKSLNLHDEADRLSDYE